MSVRSTYVVLAVVVMLALASAFACSEAMCESCVFACFGRVSRVENPRRLLARIALALRSALASSVVAIGSATVSPQPFAHAGLAPTTAALSLRI